MNIEVKPTEDGKFGLYVNGQLIGTSKHQYDADFAAQVIRRAHAGSITDPFESA